MNIFINMEPIKLKDLLPEQITAPNKRDSKIFQAQFNKSSTLSIYKKEYPTEYKIAKTIYDGKGWLWDDEVKVIKAFRSIKTTKQFNIVQKIFSLMSGRQNVIKYAASYIDVGTNTVKAPTSFKYIKAVISHLSSIGVSDASLKPMFEKYNWVNTYYKWNVDQAQQPDSGGELAWITWGKRAAVDPEFKHQYLMTLGLVTSLIPLVGPYVSSGIMAVDAAAYWNEGDRYNSGLAAIFASLPMIGPIGRMLSKIPGVGTVTSKVLVNIARKIASSGKDLSKLMLKLNPTELKIWKKLVEKKDFVTTELNKYFQQMAKKAPKVIQSIGKKGSAVIKQIANGTITGTKVGAKLLTRGALKIAPYVGAQLAWDKAFYDLGLDKWEQESGDFESYEIGSDPRYKQATSY